MSRRRHSPPVCGAMTVVFAITTIRMLPPSRSILPREAVHAVVSRCPAGFKVSKDWCRRLVPKPAGRKAIAVWRIQWRCRAARFG